MDERNTPTFFGEWLKRRRQSLDLTQAELAQRAGCSVFALRKIEAGERRPSKQLAGLLAEALQIGPAELPAFVRAARGELASDRLPRPASPAPEPLPLAPAWLRNWPAQPTPLVGRAEELAALDRLLSDPLCRLLTLIGPGGIGKTRLAIEAAARAQPRFSHSACFVPLAPLNTASAVVSAIADALGISLRGQTEPRLQLLDYLADQQVLLLLDNVEHLLECAGLLAEILVRAPAVKLLVTSRERLNLQSEWVYVTPGLPTPPADQLAHALDYDAIKLFVQSARRARPHFALQREEIAAAAHICRLVEGMPLGIELAAAWVTVLSCQEIAQEIGRNLDFLQTSLRDLPSRQRSLRAAFDHSWRLLTGDEQAALSRLSVFRGGFDRAAAEQVAEASLPVLLALASKSLIRRSESGRYDLHEVVRQYALARLAETPAHDLTRDRHARFYLALLDGREPVLRSGVQRQTLRALRDEIDNLRSAWDWAVARGLFDAITPAVRSFGCLFELSGWLEEGVRLLEAAIQAVGDRIKEPWQRRLIGEALAQQALLLMRQGHFVQALERAGASLTLLRPLADPNPLVRPLLFRSIILHMYGELDESQTAVEEALACARQVGDCWGEAYAEFLLGRVADLRGDHQAGYVQMQRGLSMWRKVGDPHAIALGLNFLSPAAIQLGRYTEAEALLQESLALCQEVDDRWTMGTALRFLGLAALAQGNARKAQELLRRSLDVHRTVVTGWDIARTLIYLGAAALALGDVEEARGHYSQALVAADEAHAPPLAAEARQGLAQVEAQTGDP